MRVVLVLLLAAATVHASDYAFDDRGVELVYPDYHEVRCSHKLPSCSSERKLFCNEVSRSCNCVPNTRYNYTARTCQPCLVMTERTCPLCCPEKGWHCSNGECKPG